ncbi:MAG: hypothetical protein GXP55_14405 [Deltaproteobacteria bacterium]|nr:hypothetical protein [Deltaproteobacteria bacterium]
MNHDNPQRPASAAHLAFPACIALLALGLSACASGGGTRGSRDSGTAPQRDSSTTDGMIVPRPDSSVDSGRPDTGITLMDSGPRDTGPRDTGPDDTGPGHEPSARVHDGHGLRRRPRLHGHGDLRRRALRGRNRGEL